MNTVTFYRPESMTRPNVHDIFIYEEDEFVMPAGQASANCATGGEDTIDHSANNAAAEAAAEEAEEYQAAAEARLAEALTTLSAVMNHVNSINDHKTAAEGHKQSALTASNNAAGEYDKADDA